MSLPTRFFKAVAAFGLVLSCATASAGLYRFQFSANPGALNNAPGSSQDVLHTVTVDTSKITRFNGSTLQDTATWLNGGIEMTMSHQGKTVRLNDALDPNSPWVSIPGASGREGFLSLTPTNNIWFFALEFGPNNPFIEANALPYNPFVYGFLFAYQQETAYQDFNRLWAGDTSVLPTYLITTATVPESGMAGLMGIALAGCAWVSRRKRGVARQACPRAPVLG